MSIITHLFIKTIKGEPMIMANTLNLLKGHGIINDRNCSPISPRQILITRKEDLDDLSIPYGGLRENIIVEGLKEDDFVPGALLKIGLTVKIRLTFYCEPCKRIADVVPSLKSVINRRGILGVILEGGEIKLGDSIICYPKEFIPFSEVPYERFLKFIKFVPWGKVVTYKMITVGMGVAESYIRAIPKYIEKCLTSENDYPLHRIVDTSGVIISDYVPGQVELLKKEDIDVNLELNLFEDNKKYTVSLAEYLWTGNSLYLDNFYDLQYSEGFVYQYNNIQHDEHIEV